MSTINRRPYRNARNINLKGDSSGGGNLRFQGTNSATPIDSTSNGLFIDASNNLVYSSQGSTTILGAAGGGTTPSWETIFAADNTFTITPDATWTIAGNRSTATDVVTLTNIGGGSGDVIKIQNSGTGADISGTSDTWTVSKTGGATFVGVTPGGDITSTALAVDWDLLDNDAAAISFDSAGAGGILAIDTRNNAEQVLFGNDLEVTDGIGTFISTSNTVSNILVTNNTITTFGADADGAGVLVIRSTSLTTGSLLQLNLADDQLAGGFYLTCRESVGNSNDFTLGENGVMVMKGTAGSNSLTMTNGDLLLSDGSIAVTDADNATSLSVTNNSAAGNDMVTFISSGTTTGSLVRMTSTGTIVTTGSVLEVVADSATTSGAGGAGRGVVTVSVDALTTGIAMNISSLSNETLTSGSLLKLDHTYDGSGNSQITGAILDVQSSVTESGTTTQSYDVASFKRTSIHDTAGTLTAQGSVLKLENVATETGATLTDTVIGLEIVMDVDGDGAGIGVTTNQATTGVSIDVTSSAATSTGSITVTNNALTTGTAMLLTSSGTVVTTGDLLSLVGNSATTSTGLLRISGTALTDGSAIEVTGGGANMLTAGNMVDLVMGAATKGSGLVVTSTGVYTDPGVGLVEITGNSATTGDLLVLSGTGQTTGSAILATGGGANMTSSGQVIDVVMGAATAGIGVRIVSTGVYTGTTGILAVTADSATSGDVAVISGAAIIGGSVLRLSAVEGTITTGDYLVCNDGGDDVFAVKRNGHLATRQGTKPTIAVGTQNGVTAAAITNGSTDTAGIITTTGTSAAGDTIFTVTFEEAYAIAPVVIIQPVNEAAAQNADDATTGAYVSSTTTTTFVVTIPGASGATPSWKYYAIEIGS